MVAKLTTCETCGVMYMMFVAPNFLRDNKTEWFPVVFIMEDLWSSAVVLPL